MKSRAERIGKIMKQFYKLQHDYPDTTLFVQTDKGRACFKIEDVVLDMFAWKGAHYYDLVLDLGKDEGSDT